MWAKSNLVNTGLMFKALQKYPVKIQLLDRLKEILQETLIIVGAFDRNTGIPISKIIHKELKNSEMVLFNKSSHFPDLEEPDKFNKTVQEFLEQKIVSFV